MTELEKLQSQEYYNCDSEELRLQCEWAKDLCWEYNKLKPSARAERGLS